MENKKESWFEKRRKIANEQAKEPASTNYKGAMIAAFITTALYVLLAILVPSGLVAWLICIAGTWGGYFALVTLDSYAGDVIGLLLGYAFGKLIFFYSIFCMVRRYRHNKYLSSIE